MMAGAAEATAAAVEELRSGDSDTRITTTTTTTTSSSSLKRSRDSNEGEGEQQQAAATEETADGAGPNPLWKTTLCSYFRRHSGFCNHGDSCRYAHGEDELRPRPDNTWDPTSQRAKKLLKTDNDDDEDNKPNEPVQPSGGASADADVEDVLGCLDGTTTEKCIVGLPRNWDSDKLRAFLDQQGILYKTAKKKKKMTVGFLVFTDAEQLHTALEGFNGKSLGGKHFKLLDVIHRSNAKRSTAEILSDRRKALPTEYYCGKDNSTVSISSVSEHNDSTDNNSFGDDGLALKIKSVCDVVTPLAHMLYNEQLEYKKSSLLQTLKRLTRNARKACPDSIPLPEWVHKSREIGGLPCQLEGIIQSPLTNGYRNKCEFSVGYSLNDKKTVGFMLGNFREGVTAVEEPVNCPNVSWISCQYALLFQNFLQSSALPVWNRTNNTGFWRQLTVREGRNAGKAGGAEMAKVQIAEVMLIVQICSLGVDEELINAEFERMTQSLAQGASACSPPLPLSAIVIQDNKGISNAAPADCPLFPLPMPSGSSDRVITEARIHDYICNLRFCISPTAFFQVNTLAAEMLYSLAGDWAGLNQDTLLFDICCGTGTIGLTLADRVGMVVGIEMNRSAVSDAIRNADINSIKNCRFICAKAEDVIGGLLKEYIKKSQHEDPCSGAPVNGITNISNTKANEFQIDDASMTDKSPKLMKVSEVNELTEGSAICSDEIHDNALESTEGCGKANGDVYSFEKEEIDASVLQFKNVVAIVDPPRVGLHPVVIKALRTNQCLRRLVYISCNPESLVANAIELCTPTADEPQKVKNNRGWRNMGCAGLARHRAKSMPKSEPFRPVRAMAVDLFPHTPHCEMVMLFER